MSTPTQNLAKEGVSIWLDDLSRGLIASGGLKKYLDDRTVTGVTTNPTIFANAITGGEEYATQIKEVAAEGAEKDAAIFPLIITDVKNACDVLRPIYDATDGEDGRVSIEVSPELAFETEATATQAAELWEKVGKPNAMIKIPATKEGLPAITATIARGISVNVTLIFSLERYGEVIDAYLEGLKKAKDAGVDLSTIRSVASFFVSRVDTEVDKRLDAIGTPEAFDLRFKAGLANARLAYELFEQRFAQPEAQELLKAGAHVQRPLWASTGVKNPALPDTLYVTELVAPNTVNTMPGKTLEATFDHGEVIGNTIEPNIKAAREHFAALEKAGVDMKDVTELLEREGVDKFIVSWKELQDKVDSVVKAAS
ncbi:transaldolase [Actinotignum urinale]|uniref:transaldolase n=1 Tax=Actinotignum urinale TaxID=190146 RepID=UPI0003B34174|nr:transaldolase [Actinotignum urinale]MDY5159755.1 transaldolase [Actinotignum urinale]WIK58532.1 transaldolase [Actinotignum urinale]